MPQCCCCCYLLSPLRLFGSPWTVALQAPLSVGSPWTVALQAPLSMGFSRQGCWSGLPFPSPGDLPDPGSKLLLHRIGFFTAEPPGTPATVSMKRDCHFAHRKKPDTKGHALLNSIHIKYQSRQVLLFSFKFFI